TKHLLELGHKRIAHIEGDPQYWTSNQRREGYCKALRDAGIQSEESLIEKGFYDEQLAYKAMTILLKRETFTAVFVANDIMALGVYRAIRERGLKIPSDISVVGFDDTEFARLVDPPLTTVKKPWQEVGREATKAMLSLLESEAGTETTIKKVALMNRLIIRESSGGGRRNHT
ncbi:MAG: substrate-binding domain-containing protein, partial [Treponema sp.]|nr:substrate-binding domain-containing protein [Treponema sp.]